MKICFVASSGGHWEELMCLCEIAEEKEAFFITEKGGQAEDSKIDSLYVVEQINRREALFIVKFFCLLFKSLFLLLKESPDVIISTGALIAYPFCLWGKILNKKIIYIESFARVHGKSLTGKLVYPFADLFLVQWETMLEYYPKAKYIGGIF